MMMGTVLVICRQDGITPRPMIYAVLDVVVNLTRSFPFLILMIAVIPLTRLLVGTTIGNNATVVPLVIAAAPSWPGLWNPPCSKWTAASLRRRSPWGVHHADHHEGAFARSAAFAHQRQRHRGDHDLATPPCRARRRRGPRQTGDHVRVQPLPADIMFITVVLLIVIVQVFQSFGNWATKRSDRRIS